MFLNYCNKCENITKFSGSHWIRFITILFYTLYIRIWSPSHLLHKEVINHYSNDVDEFIEEKKVSIQFVYNSAVFKHEQANKVHHATKVIANSMEVRTENKYYLTPFLLNPILFTGTD